MAKDVLSRLKPLADELMACLERSRTCRAARRAAEAAEAERSAGLLMTEGPLATWMVRYFERRQIPAGEAEELAMDVWSKLVQRGYVAERNAFALLCRMAHSRLADHFRHLDATGEAALRVDLTPDDEGTNPIDDAQDPADPFSVLDDCVRRKLQVLRRQDPDSALMLERVATGLTYQEIAALVYEKPLDDVSEGDAHNMRSRAYEARLKAKPLFDECRD